MTAYPLRAICATPIHHQLMGTLTLFLYMLGMHSDTFGKGPSDVSTKILNDGMSCDKLDVYKPDKCRKPCHIPSHQRVFMTNSMKALPLHERTAYLVLTSSQ